MASIHQQDVISCINVKRYYIALTNDPEIKYFITNCIAKASLNKIKFHKYYSEFKQQANNKELHHLHGPLANMLVVSSR